MFEDPWSNRMTAPGSSNPAWQEMGGLDTVINLIHIDPASMGDVESIDDVEGFIAAQIEAAAMITRVAANRMRLTLTEGSILNVVTMPSGARAAQRHPGRHRPRHAGRFHARLGSRVGGARHPYQCGRPAIVRGGPV